MLCKHQTQGGSEENNIKFIQKGSKGRFGRGRNT